MTALRLRWQRSVAIAATGAAAFLGTAIAAAPAQAHTPKWSVDCYSVQIDLTSYAQDKDNTVTLKAGDKTLLTETFKGQFHKKVDLPKHTKPLTVTAQVKAGDDDKYSWGPETKTSPVCATKPPKPTPTEEPTKPAPTKPAPSSTPSQTEKPQPTAPESSTTAPASNPQGGGENLAETGSSSNTPMIAGIAAAVVVVGGGLVVFARKRRSTQG
ncbi:MULTISPECIES: Hsp20/alpha crystallin family protein [unclassified Streptomyces]|uniref:Hsp20/alpha crystallin family protein n=1 Tax=unclassified Streptomyces TaxID=2593676 RepID=UPI002DDC51E8|nr:MULTISPECIES: Hsp20/alpha crystallin family protein [unclassified Streptomyces]WSA92269.1 Hsp20/alpha crystallin family protein [Streptomyces sp. NBC_01795]WSB76635.1 Hsp20/alpha crystallin family protein [Streptomyces sp. NBC_01775]WSS15078.1 Hsp20/alpha crystallin family protein [Streptomyces sp. NBC_01186]WSS43921.1 Hsp20/alpha crystallin family protein [Streptomyces sp. NBC_01187]